MVTFESLEERRDRIAVVGLGYVGLPLAIHLSRHFDVVGFDLKQARIPSSRQGTTAPWRWTVPPCVRRCYRYTADPEELSRCRLIIVAVPTPIDDHRIPDLTPLTRRGQDRRRAVVRRGLRRLRIDRVPGGHGGYLRADPGGPVGVGCGEDFTVGYSPERINPGDKVHSLDKIMKVVAGSDAAPPGCCGASTAGWLRPASTGPLDQDRRGGQGDREHPAGLNIALMNELAMIFDQIGIDTSEVLAAAGTKWNFLTFRPGLVGGHCIGVDPYYLTFKAESLRLSPRNDPGGAPHQRQHGQIRCGETVKMLIGPANAGAGANVAVLGLTFKENVPDLRNTKVVDIIPELNDYGVKVRMHDPLAEPEEARRYYGLELTAWDQLGTVDAVILTVLHDDYRERGLAAISAHLHPEYPLLLDVKGAFRPEDADALGLHYWRL